MRSNKVWGLTREGLAGEGLKQHAGKMQSDVGMRKEAVLLEPLREGGGAQAGDISVLYHCPPDLSYHYHFSSLTPSPPCPCSTLTPITMSD